MPEPDVIVAEPGVDGAACAALIVRARGQENTTHFFRSEELPAFFRRDYQEGLPRFYNLFICGLRVVRKDWQARPARAPLMEALRGLEQPATWFSTAHWEADDEAAVGHLIGENDLVVSPSYSSTAALVAERLPGQGEPLDRELVSMAEGCETDSLDNWRRVLAAHRNNAEVLSRVVTVLARGQVGTVPRQLMQRTERVEKENQRIAGEQHDARRMGEVRVVFVELPRDKTAFWRDIGAAAMETADAGIGLIHPDAADVTLFLKDPTRRLDLQAWLRYLTDCMPGSETLDGGPDWTPVHIQNLGTDPTVKRQLLDILRGGAHLLTAS